MIILGISEGHEAHACILRDGVLVAAIAEERLSRIKMDSRYPRRAIDSVLATAAIDPAEIDIVAFAGKSDWIWATLYNKHAKFSVQDWIDECDLYWKPILLEGKTVSPFAIFDRFRHHGGPDLESEPYYPMLDQVRHAPVSEWGAIGDAIRTQTIRNHLGLGPDKVRFLRHEDCHKAYGLYSSPGPRQDTLVLTIEGGGDDSSATVSTMKADGAITEHWTANDVQAGRLYAYVTLILGMKPGQHEFKVMGLAPYGDAYHGAKSRDFFRTVNRVEGTRIVNPGNLPDLYYTVREALRGQRFDGIAWGLQEWLEELLSEWVAANCAEHDLSNVILSGGVAQNIKACKTLSELPQVDGFWAGPVSGDGSIGIGAAWLASRAMAPEIEIEGLPHIYLGTGHDARAVDDAVTRRNLAQQFQIHEHPTSAQVADWMVDGQVVARYAGRMEFGQRALGNRSILADPRHAETVERINNKIKYRDFWMPFTPSMTMATADRMLHNPKQIYSPFMTLAFDLKPEYRDAIPAAIHPADKTARPQMLKRETNPGYHDLLSAMEERTGIGCLMNTSFNLHGDAIVESPDDAIDTFEKSQIDVLLFEDIAIRRPPS
ncbi:MAG: carbamoyltransferase C-terminal domain-containing protein [Alphaproteobacteria bacterium]